RRAQPGGDARVPDRALAEGPPRQAPGGRRLDDRGSGHGAARRARVAGRERDPAEDRRAPGGVAEARRDPLLAGRVAGAVAGAVPGAVGGRRHRLDRRRGRRGGRLRGDRRGGRRGQVVTHEERITDGVDSSRVPGTVPETRLDETPPEETIEPDGLAELTHE